MAEDIALDLITLTASVVEAYVSNNKVSSDDLAVLIGTTYEALRTAGEPAPVEPQTPKPDRAAIKKSISADHLTSFIDGRKYKSLKRHLAANGATPASYRDTYGLPSDYPLVAANYSAQRSALAKSLGLGRKAASAPAPAPAPAPAAVGDAEGTKAKGRGRAKAIKPQDETFN